MRLHRIGSLAFNLFDGTGASLHGGRWNSPGRPVIYCGLSVAACQLEMLIHLDKARPAINHGWIVIDVPDDIAVTSIDRSDLPAGWNHPMANTVAQDIGDRWLDEGRTAILRVPSVAAANDWVVALNPTHPEVGRMTAGTPIPLTWDPRLFVPPQA